MSQPVIFKLFVLFLALCSIPDFVLLWSIMKVSGRISQTEKQL